MAEYATLFLRIFSITSWLSIMSFISDRADENVIDADYMMQQKWRPIVA
jgi:hypothetical protein